MKLNHSNHELKHWSLTNGRTHSRTNRTALLSGNVMQRHIYEHIRPDTNTVFYVGKGTTKRSESKHRRNAHWKNIVNKAGGYSVRIVFSHEDEELLFLIEQELIWKRKQEGLKLANKTEGGEGPSGHRHTDETKRIISEKQTGDNHWTRKHPVTEERRARMRHARSKFVYTDEIRKKISEAGKLKKNSPETRAKISAAKQGSRHHMARLIEYDGQLFGCTKDLAEHLGENYSVVRQRVAKCPEKFGYKILGYTKDFKDFKHD